MTKYQDYIQPWSVNPRYWQYKGKPSLLLGGSVEDNLFQIDNLELHLDTLASAGGNYVRCTMSSRDEGNVWAYAKKDGLYDLEQWNPEYWRRFEAFLDFCEQRDIIVQVELWAYHDFYDSYGAWRENPYNPAANCNYDESSARISAESVRAEDIRRNRFFWTVPRLDNNAVVLHYQKRFVDKVLSYTFKRPNVLYCMTNEIHPEDSAEWGWYWAGYVREKAREVGVPAQTTEMYWPPDMHRAEHRCSIDHPELFTFFEAAQNSAVRGDENWNNLMYLRQALASSPRPINNVKMYGSDEYRRLGVSTQEVIARFWRAILGGCASARFHRPPHGIGLSERAQAQLKSARMVCTQVDVFSCTPFPEIFLSREEEGGWCMAKPGDAYVLYFPRKAAVTVKLSTSPGRLVAQWLEIDKSAWREVFALDSGDMVEIEPPEQGNWALVCKSA